ncbi:hypothetical protein [Azonexus sp.]|uniref:hypothetical protein n=1 Tax=Azonexus sp. TaxID=1872668 RepID=UPI0039E57A30
MALIRFAWLSWLLAVMLFFSGVRGSAWLVLLLLLAGFALTAAYFIRAAARLFSPRQ